jgi:hypothetical protein
MSHDYILEERKPVVVYDVTIEDITERRKKAVEYDTMKKACNTLGIGYTAMRNAIVSRKRIFSTTMNQYVAIRYKKST